ncbi:hypothetical protein AVEN_195675-1 [Araneus ventricosus]|uniref:Uncharacterized protein n=1 Tax=Araneus ventricosus TaxID=182803 RepID=A0A4Y2BBM5_ARAVE|nr:hypothetical protein AVEN_195675-1 [Araneus ventricosus]
MGSKIPHVLSMSGDASDGSLLSKGIDRLVSPLNALSARNQVKRVKSLSFSLRDIDSHTNHAIRSIPTYDPTLPIKKQRPRTLLITGQQESLGYQEFDQENIQDWLEHDVDHTDYFLPDDEIIANVIDDQTTCDDEGKSNINVCAKKGPFNEEAIHCLETIMKWLKQQEQFDTVFILSN